MRLFCFFVLLRRYKNVLVFFHFGMNGVMLEPVMLWKNKGVKTEGGFAVDLSAL